jgi:hypothetical protein
MIESLPRGPFTSTNAATAAIHEWVSASGAKETGSSAAPFTLELPNAMSLELRFYTVGDHVYIGVTQTPSRP